MFPEAGDWWSVVTVSDAPLSAVLPVTLNWSHCPAVWPFTFRETDVALSYDVRRDVCVAAAAFRVDPELCPELLAEHADIRSHFVGSLSAEEQDVLSCLCVGASTPAMARSMNLSEW